MRVSKTLEEDHSWVSKSMQTCKYGKAQHFKLKLPQDFESADVEATFGVVLLACLFLDI